MANLTIALPDRELDRITSELANIIKLILTGNSKDKLILIIGDGIMAQPDILVPEVLIEDFRKNNPGIVDTVEKKYCICWNQYERVKIFSYLVVPEFSYYLVEKMCSAGLIRGIISTNYDLTFESIYDKYKDLDLSSLLKYYSPLSTEYLGAENLEKLTPTEQQSKKIVDFVKIHGTFSTFVHTSEPRKRFRTDYDNLQYINSFKDLLKIKFALQVNSNYIEIDRICSALKRLSSKDLYFPYVDLINSTREWFQKEINWALEYLDSYPSDIIVAIGFRGQYYQGNPTAPYSEELVDKLIKRRKTGGRIFQLLERHQSRNRPGLAKLLDELSPDDLCSGKQITHVLGETFRKANICRPEDLKAQYDNKWVTLCVEKEVFLLEGALGRTLFRS